MIENKVYSEKQILDNYLKPYKMDGEIVTFVNNIGNRYHFKKVEDGLEFIEIEKNLSKICKGFHN